MLHYFLCDVSKQQNIVISNPFFSEENDKMLRKLSKLLLH